MLKNITIYDQYDCLWGIEFLEDKNLSYKVSHPYLLGMKGRPHRDMNS